MSEELTEFYRFEKRRRKAEGEQNRARAESDFDAARAALAGHHGLSLKRCQPGHYQLIASAGWLINIYPGNRRIYGDRNHAKAPFFMPHLPDEWTLLDVVNAAIKIVEAVPTGGAA